MSASTVSESEWPVYERRESILRREIVVLFAGIALLLAASAAAWYFLYAVRSPIVVVKRFIEADIAGNFSAQQQCVSSRWDSRFILSALQAFRQGAGASPFTGYQILGSSESGSTASVNVQVTLVTPNAPAKPAAPGAAPGVWPGLGNTFTVPFMLVREDGDWKIDPSGTMAGLMGLFAAAGIQQLAPNLPNLLPPGGIPGFPTFVPPPASTPAPAAPPPSSSAPDSI